MRNRLWGIATPTGLAVATYAVFVSSADSRIPGLVDGSASSAVMVAPSANSGVPEATAAPAVASESLIDSGPVFVPPSPAFVDLGRRRVIAQARVLRHEKLIEDEAGRAIDGGFPKSFVRADGRSDGGVTPIVNEGALRPFHEALSKLSAGHLEGGKVRILAFGASHTQADLYTGYVRTYLQERFGNGGIGFVNVRKLDRWDRKLAVTINGAGFRLERIRGRNRATPGWFGLLGASAVAKAGAAHARLELDGERDGSHPAMTVELHCMGTPNGSDVEVALDGVVRARFSTRTEAPAPLFHTVEAPSGFSRLELRKIGPGELRVFGVSIERNDPGVVLDTLGIQGSKLTDWLEADEAVWRAAVERRKPHLVTLAYGTNEFTNPALTIANYRKELEQVFGRLKRAAPEATCLLIGPGDLGRARTERGRARLAAIVETQQEFALRYGCGFWNTFEFMGGEGAMARWVRANPPMASSDRTHLNRRGYVLMGMRLADALLRALDQP